MGKRSNFERNDRDYYRTPMKAVLPLVPHITQLETFAEPCAGDGTLVKHLEKFLPYCYWKSDIEPQDDFISKRDALSLTNPLKKSDLIITNPPWDRKILHPMIDHFRQLSPTWLLFDADWQYTVQKNIAKKYNTKTAPELLEYCHKIVAVGRVSWMNNGKSGVDNCAWYLFDKDPAPTIFYGRTM